MSGKRGTYAVHERTPINILFGVPDDNKALLHVTADGSRLQVDLLGTAGIVAHLSAQRFAVNVLYLQPGRETPTKLGPGGILNHIADADLCSGALKMAEQITAKVARPCFNHPTKIARTTRDEVARILAGTPGLKVPKTIRIRAATPAEVLKAIESTGLLYPLLIRVAGSHGGKNMIKIDRPDAIDGIVQLKRDDQSLYVTEFRDFVSPDGSYRKFRVVVVGDDIFLRTCIVGKNWLLNRRARAANSEHEERGHLAGFDTEWAPRLRPIFHEIARRLGLDYFGVDCNIDKEGEVLLFEANACMNVLKNNFPAPNMWDVPIARIRAAVENYLASPTNWRQHRGAK
jgi:glutathione synthase/RimK-type ligase-like ATP-grasp enzyme